MKANITIRFVHPQFNDQMPPLECKLTEISEFLKETFARDDLGREEWEIPIHAQAQVLEQLYSLIRKAVNCYNASGTLPDCTIKQAPNRHEDKQDTEDLDHQQTPKP